MRTITIEERNAVFVRAKAIVLAGWTQGSFARNAEGGKVSTDDPAATCFCMYGAVIKAGDNPDYVLEGACADALRSTVFAITGQSIVGYNDAPGRTVYEVAAVFDHAVECPL